MPIFVKDAGVWKDSAPWVKDGGVWKPAQNGFVKDSGVWKEIFTNRLPPFSMSGTFASNEDGWNLGGAQTVWNNTQVRTSPGSIYMPGSSFTANWMEYTIPKDVCGGLTLTLSIWHRGFGFTANRRLQYKIGTGAFSILANANNASTTYARLSGSFENPGNDDVVIRCDANQIAYWDDWSISGL